MSIFWVFLIRIQSKLGKIRIRRTPNTDSFHAVKDLEISGNFCKKRQRKLIKFVLSYVKNHHKNNFLINFLRNLKNLRNSLRKGLWNSKVNLLFSGAKKPNVLKRTTVIISYWTGSGQNGVIMGIAVARVEEG